MESGWKDEIRKKKCVLMSLFLILVIGIFLRTYNFRDWLPFNPDQARDTKIANDWTTGKTGAPLLGPKAGGTEFHMGPIFYYFEFASAKLFGGAPDKMAYPDLFFSLLAIPLFFLLLRKYFSVTISLTLTFLFSISFFVVQYSRFSWNPNQIPFFTLLLFWSILQLLDEKAGRKLVWSVLLAVAAAVLIQLHTLLLVALPVFLGAAMVYLFFQKSIGWREMGAIILVVVFLNLGQIYSEVLTRGANARQFLSSSNSRSNSSMQIGRNVQTIILCQAQAGLHIIYPLDTQEKCDLFSVVKNIQKSKSFQRGVEKNIAGLTVFVAALIFSLGGYGWVYYFYRREKDTNKKNFLRLLAAYNFLLLLVFLPVAAEIQIRYFIILFFVPFVLLGLWLKRAEEVGRNLFWPILVGALGVALILNGVLIRREYQEYARGNKTDMENAIMQDLLPMVNYIEKSSAGIRTIQLAGRKLYLIRFAKPIGYLLETRGIEVITLKEGAAINEQLPVFYFTKNSDGDSQTESPVEEFVIKDLGKFNKIMIYKLVAPENNILRAR